MMDKKDLEEVFNLLHELQDAVEDSDETLFYEKMNDAIYPTAKFMIIYYYIPQIKTQHQDSTLL